jgi:DNA-binding NarL/FixJ family response regulator
MLRVVANCKKMSVPILAVVEDLIFLSKIRQTAQESGIAVESVEITKIAERIPASSPCVVILDLNHRSGRALETARALKSSADSSRIHVVGFLSHVQADLAREARQAGVDQVMARSVFAGQLPEILRQLAAL